MTPCRRLAQAEPRSEIEKQHQHYAIDDRRAAYLERSTKRAHRFRNFGDGLRIRVQLRDREGDIHRSECHDERRKLDGGNERPIDQTEQRRHADSAGNRHGHRQTELRRKLCHHDAAERHHHPARQVDSGGENDQSLPNGNHANHHHLLQHERKVFAGQEAITLRAEESARDEEREQRPDRTNGRQAFPPVVSGAAYFFPKHSSRPVLTSLLSTPFTGLAAMSETPVSVYPLGFLPVLMNAAPAATPSAAIFSGYCCAVAAIRPAPTSLTPSQPPSTETITTPFSLRAALKALYAPAAVGSLIVYTRLMSGFF